MSQVNSEVSNVPVSNNVPDNVPDNKQEVKKEVVKFEGKYAGISTDCFVFLTLRCGVSEVVAIKVSNDAASSMGRVMQGVSNQVSFGRMTKDLLADIKETSQRKGVSVNEFPLQVAYLAEKTRKFCFDNKVKISSIELPENLANYLRDLQK
jgi:hypothetical protein